MVSAKNLKQDFSQKKKTKKKKTYKAIQLQLKELEKCHTSISHET